MKVIQPIEPYTMQFTKPEHRGSIFLAGPCPRSNYADDWRRDAFKILESLGFSGNVYTPTNQYYGGYREANGKICAYKAQTAWERRAMHVASAIVFWIPRSKDRPGLTTNIEFGEWYKRNGVYVGFPPGAEHVDYMKIKLGEQNKPWFSDLETMLKAVVDDVEGAGPADCFFTADTHFTQKRTLQLSRRPFRSLKEMDLSIISNWNKVVRPRDKVYHAGDFIDPAFVDRLGCVLSCLNFSELHWTLGNYDRSIEFAIRDVVDRHVRETGRVVRLYGQGECSTTVGERKFRIFHEPNWNAAGLEPGEIALYGHIHGRGFAKRNGFDLASDYHGFTPLSSEQISWFANAMQYWDENVYSDSVG